MTLLLKSSHVCKNKACDLKGITIYFTDPRHIGESKSASPGVVQGLLGFSSAKLVHRDQDSYLECEVRSRDLVEIYGDAAGVLTEIDKREWFLGFVVIGPLALLYLLMPFIFKRAGDALLRCNETS